MGVLKAKFLKAMYENKPKFPGGRGVQNKKPSMGGVWIFSGTAQCCLQLEKNTKRQLWLNLESVAGNKLITAFFKRCLEKGRISDVY